MDRKLAAIVVILGAISFFLDDVVQNFSFLVQHQALSYLMEWLSNVSTMLFAMVIVASLFLWNELKKRWIFVVWASFALSATASIAIKEIVMRPRPGVYEGLLFSQYSFPSMHAALAFSLLPVLGREFPKLKVFWIAFAALIALSRIYLNVHFLSDIVFGAILGYFVGGYIVKSELKLKWTKKLFLK